MINKQNLWFLTLFSLILVLSVYYITMPSELLLTNNSNYENVENSEESKETIQVTSSELLIAMRVNLDEERTKERQTLQETLTSGEASSDDKNKAYEELKMLDKVKATEEAIEAKIKQQFHLENFVRIDGSQIQIVVISKDHSNKLANDIMRCVQAEFEDKVYITVKFEK